MKSTTYYNELDAPISSKPFLTAMLIRVVLQSILLDPDFIPKLAINTWKLELAYQSESFRLTKGYSELKLLK